MIEHQPNDVPDVEEAEPIVGDESSTDQTPLPEVEDYPPILELEEAPRSTTNGSAVALGLIIAAAFILGLTLGFFGRPAFIQDLPIQVVVTVVPNEAETVAQANNQTTEVEQPSAANPEVSSAAESNLDTAGPTPTIMDFVLSDARHFQGDDKAKVTVVEFSDFNCGFCGRFATETLDQLRKDYVETGKVLFAYKHFAILGPTSNRAAEASECASEQDKFWDFHDTTFANRVSGKTDLSDNSLIAQAADIGLDVAEFSDCLTSDKYTSQIKQEALSVQSLGVRGTPGFLINGVFISGAQPYEVFQEVIDEQLASLE